MLEGLVDLFHVSKLHFGELVLLQTCNCFSLKLINLVGFLSETLLHLVELFLFGLVLGTDLLALGIQFLNDLVSFAYFVLCRLNLRLKFGDVCLQHVVGLAELRILLGQVVRVRLGLLNEELFVLEFPLEILNQHQLLCDRALLTELGLVEGLVTLAQRLSLCDRSLVLEGLALQHLPCVP